MLNTDKLIVNAITSTLNPFVGSSLPKFVYAYQQKARTQLKEYGLTISQLGIFSNEYNIYMVWGIAWEEGVKFVRWTWQPDGEKGNYEIYDRNPQ